MADRKNVIKGLEWILNDIEENGHYHVGYYADEIRGAITLLKEQEPVKPKYNARTNWYECGACHYSMTSGMHCRSELIPAFKVGYCAKCGRKVQWE